MAKLHWVQAPRGRTQHRAYAGSQTAFCGLVLGADAVWSNASHNPCSECIARDPERAEFIDSLLEFLAQAGTLTSVMRLQSGRLKLGARFFDGAEPMFKMELTHPGEGWVDPKLTPRDVRWPLDMRF